MVIIIGSHGQLGLEMQKQMNNKGISYSAYDYPEVDITDKVSLRRLIEAIKPNVVINCAAYTNVDAAETDEENAYKVNALGAKYLAELCNEFDIELVHISTDYVFSGEGIVENGILRPYIESDICEPNTVYGKTKNQGEQFVQSNCKKYYILRTAWLYGDGNNFVRTMLSLAQKTDTITVVNDQIGSPTSTTDLAKAIICLLGSGEYGLYHATCEGQCSWFEFAERIFEIKKINVNIVPITSEQLIRTAKRPAWSVLENAALKSIDKNVFRNWEESLTEYLVLNKDV